MSLEMPWLFQMHFVEVLKTLGDGRKRKWEKNVVVYSCKENNSMGRVIPLLSREMGLVLKIWSLMPVNFTLTVKK